MAAVVMGVAGAAAGQSTLPAAFVANNGNREGAVTSFTIDPETGVLTRVQKLVLGSTPTSAQVPGCNAYSIDLSPDGRTLVVTHATSFTTEQVSLIRVNPDASLTLIRTFTTPDSPLDGKWIANDLLAITRTQSSGGSSVIIYRWNEAANTVTEIDREPTGAFNSNIAISPDATLLFANDSTGLTLRVFRIGADGRLTFASQTATSVYQLGMAVTADGSKLYAGGGAIGSPANKVLGFTIDPVGGTISELAFSPAASSGNSPKQVAFSPDERFALVGHGSSSTVNVFTLDSETGQLVETPFFVDVGIQGELGEIATLRLPSGRDIALFTDRQTFGTPARGLMSFTIDPSSGTLTQNGPLVDTLGIDPIETAVWPGTAPTCACPVDYDGSGSNVPDLDDLLAFFRDFNEGDTITSDGDPSADVNCTGEGSVADVEDVIRFFAAFTGGC